MAKKNLYLIRRNLEDFLGPWDIERVREEFQKMAFGRQDEIAGHLMGWIPIDDKEGLRMQYPEVFTAFYRMGTFSQLSSQTLLKGRQLSYGSSKVPYWAILLVLGVILTLFFMVKKWNLVPN